MDFYRWSGQRASMKELSDTLATRGAREFLLANTSESQIKAVLDAAVRNGVAKSFGLEQVKINTEVDVENMSVRVSVGQAPKEGLILTKFSPYKDDMTTSSKAVARGGMNVCVVALEDNKNGAISASLAASLDAPDCSILSNSSKTNGIVASGYAKISANMICSAGGYSGSASNFDPVPTTDCPEYEDPLKERSAPNVTSPVFYDTMLGERSKEIFMAALSDSITEASLTSSYSLTAPNDADASESDYEDSDDTALDHRQYTLDPGVYEGGITIASNADVTFSPGVYVIKDGPLAIDMGARITGIGVSFYLLGDDAVFSFGPDCKIDLEAPIDGPMAGILFFEDRGAPIGRTHRILSNDARNLLGTFYLPRGALRISTMQPIADQSDYTIIVARELQLSGSPTLVLNTRYAQSQVPVPSGIGPTGGTTFLRE